jgi:hypothetical protein
VRFVFVGAKVPTEYLGAIGPAPVLDFVAHRTELAALYAAADVFMGASREDTFGQTYPGAMSSGLPVTALAAGGITDILISGVTGMLVNPSYPAGGLANALSEFCACPVARRQQTGHAARTIAASRFGAMSTLRDWAESLDKSGPAARFGYTPVVNALDERPLAKAPPEMFFDTAQVTDQGLLPNKAFDDFAQPPWQFDFDNSAHDCLQYCMGFDEATASLFMQAGAPLFEYVREVSDIDYALESSGVFVLRRLAWGIPLICEHRVGAVATRTVGSEFAFNLG